MFKLMDFQIQDKSITYFIVFLILLYISKINELQYNIYVRLSLLFLIIFCFETNNIQIGFSLTLLFIFIH